MPLREMRMSDRSALYGIAIPLLALSAWCGAEFHQCSLQRAAIKEDFAHVNSIKYGLLSVDVWRDRIQKVVSGSISDFVLSRSQENDLKKVISNVLLALIDEADGLLQKRRRTLSEKIRKMVVSTFFDTSDLRKKVPALTQSIIDEIKKPQNKEKIKHLAQTQLNTYSAESYDNDDNLSPVNRTLAKYQTDTTAEFNRKVKDDISTLDSQAMAYSGAMLVCLFLFLILGWRLWRDISVRKLLFTIGLGFALLFLLTAVTTPMMEIDARINKVDIVFVGKHLLFEDQVLFYRSKSILQVVRTMFDTGEASSTLVGILILLFSIFFPIAKLISAQWVLLGGEKAKTNKWLHFFAFKSGKWSMADVMVIAIFMAFIGFNGMLKNQLEGFNMKTDTLECISTSGTSLQPGCILFVVFVFFGLFLSVLLDHLTTSPQDQE